LKIAICIPCYGDPKLKFMQSLTSLIIHTMGARIEDDKGNPVAIELEVFIVSTSMLTEGRHRLVAEALTWGADYMFCLDADHTFPADALLRLLGHNLPVVGCNYARRFTPTAPTAAINSGDDDSPSTLLYTTQEKAETGLVEECAHLGFGVLLIDMRIFDALQAHAEAHGDGNFLPLFKFVETPDKIGMVGEDVFFFRKLAKAGITPFVDHALSWQVGHVFEMVMTNQTAWNHRDKWGEHMKRRADKFKAKVEALEAADVQ